MTIGIMGGTFDPVHNGHLGLAEQAKTTLGCDRILWIPTGRPPHKSTAVSDRDRIAMLRLAIEGLDGHALDLCEMERSGYTRTVDTLRDLHARFDGARFIFFIGADTVLQLRHWKDFATVAALCEFGVAVRPTVADTAMEEELASLTRAFGLRYHRILMEHTPVSSSDIREKLARGEDVSGQVPGAVLSYIQTNHLYKELV